jgi:hypothetical protein
VGEMKRTPPSLENVERTPISLFGDTFFFLKKKCRDRPPLLEEKRATQK